MLISTLIFHHLKLKSLTSFDLLMLGFATLISSHTKISMGIITD